MQTSKIFFLVLMVLVSGIGLWVGGKLLYSVYHYFLLSQEAPAFVKAWKVEELRPGKFTIGASFEFRVHDKMVFQEFRFPTPIYQNPYLAEALIERWKEKSWQVWYQSKNPQVATLQKKFPIKEGIYFVLSLGVFLYFSYLRIYIEPFHG